MIRRRVRTSVVFGVSVSSLNVSVTSRDPDCQELAKLNIMFVCVCPDARPRVLTRKDDCC